MKILSVSKLDEAHITNIIRQVTRQEIKSLLNEMNNHAEDNILLSRKEAVKMLPIFLPTLHQCRKEGRIPLYRTGGRVLYKKAEIFKVIELPVKYKRNYKKIYI